MTPELFTASDYFVAAELETGVATSRLLEIVPHDRLLLALFAPYAGPDGSLRSRPLPQLAAALAVSLAREELLDDEGLFSGERLRPQVNDDVAVTAMVGFLAKNGRPLQIARGHHAREHARAVDLVERVLDGEAREDDLAAWVAERIV
ncbi:hypothetical protein Q5424_00455 [Conexibacter sp. JD483]|uniref:hypothetical protein n=1 Tax=unclassified Conexibacter TaxID=2627773 RepID=UPI002718B3CF|nr:MULTISPECIES: hypothetical protein [unclassified Conexibacter]MDO8184166.1 hypothetical protein [Conexibacter sp. CPCC 205706]MDO8197158.1 hypothetical protein [Conexibacter sp. CPCC 205762]MDR9367527.1 hypothetical protein [Conexibacter sp. JD483]